MTLPVKRRTKDKENADEFQITLSKRNTVFLVFGIIFMASGHPGAQKVGTMLLGISSPAGNIEEIKADVQTTKMQIAELKQQGSKVEEKLNAVLVEFEQLRMERKRTAVIK